MNTLGRPESGQNTTLGELSPFSHTATRLPTGDFLFFPAIDNLTEFKGPIKRITIISDAHFGGNLLGDTLHVTLDHRTFSNLRKFLDRLDLSKKEVVFRFEIDRDSTLLRFQVDNGEVCNCDRKYSGIEALRQQEDSAAAGGSGGKG